VNPKSLAAVAAVGLIVAIAVENAPKIGVPLLVVVVLALLFVNQGWLQQTATSNAVAGNTATATYQ